MNPGPSFSFVYERACAFLLEEGIDRLPVDPAAIIRCHRWGLATYQSLAELAGIPDGDLSGLFVSGDGYTIFNGRNYCIAYNHAVASLGRISFTLMHEIGHIVLGHFTDGFSQNWAQALSGAARTSPVCAARECEAHFFASCVMAPSVVIARCGFTTPEVLSGATGLSLAAARSRLMQHRQWRFSDADKPLARRFDAYIKASQHTRADMSGLTILCD